MGNGVRISDDGGARCVVPLPHPTLRSPATGRGLPRWSLVAGRPAGWQLCDDRRSWLADVEYTVSYEWALGKHLSLIPPSRLRLTTGTDERRRLDARRASALLSSPHLPIA